MTVAPVQFDAVAQRLLERYDAAVAEVLADPRVASDLSNAKVTAFLALFPKDSSFASDTVKLWVAEAAKGRFYVPGPTGVLLKSTFRKVTSATGDRATFAVCTKRSAEVVDASGNPIEAVGGVTDGEVVAVRLDGEWFLRDLTQLATAECPKPGTKP